MAKKNTKPKWTGNDFKRARRAVESLYYYRINTINNQGPLYQDFKGPFPPRDIKATETLLANTPCFWHCVNITYCENPFGKKYILWGFAKTEQQLRIIKQPLDPVVKAAQEAAEAKANTKHIVGRAFILSPWNKQNSDLTPLVRKHAKEFGLEDADVDAIADYLSDDYEYLSYDPSTLTAPENMEDLDTQIARLL